MGTPSLARYQAWSPMASSKLIFFFMALLPLQQVLLEPLPPPPCSPLPYHLHLHIVFSTRRSVQYIVPSNSQEMLRQSKLKWSSKGKLNLDYKLHNISAYQSTLDHQDLAYTIKHCEINTRQDLAHQLQMWHHQEQMKACLTISLSIVLGSHKKSTTKC